MSAIFVLQIAAVALMCMLILTPLFTAVYPNFAKEVSSATGHAGFWQTVFSGGLLYVTFLQSRISEQQAKLAARQNELTTKQYVAANQPRFRIRNVRVVSSDDDHFVNVNFSIANLGFSSAKLNSFMTYLEIGRSQQFVTSWHGGGRSQIGVKEFPPGYEISTAAYQRQPLRGEDFRRLINRENVAGHVLIFRGALRYEDEAGVSHEASFWREFDVDGRRFKRASDIDFDQC